MSGWDNCFGNVVVIKYEKVLNHKTGKIVDCVFRYNHFANRKVSKGQQVNKDTMLGIMGMTGTYATGVHMHLEADTDTKNYVFTPTLSGSTTLFKAGYRDNRDSTFSPAEVLHIKASAPDYQTVSRTNDGYTSAADTDMPKIQ